ncbi:Fanconi anemia group I protein-like [Centruroides sculpturatus]|uniref:Fanconi anemia group I protein-like n=1 Tax=Centruroides sculpturatus TaxID=218467 RepID=UPI000C6E305D|nr:Fanconi anemia group I protein-like [Centruroides sculpturatus]
MPLVTQKIWRTFWKKTIFSSRCSICQQTPLPSFSQWISKSLPTSKKLNTRALFMKVFEECQLCGDMTVQKFWEEKFDVLVAIRLIQKAWGEVMQKTRNSAWKRLVLEWTQEEPAEDTEVVQEIILTAQELDWRWRMWRSSLKNTKKSSKNFYPRNMMKLKGKLHLMMRRSNPINQFQLLPSRTSLSNGEWLEIVPKVLTTLTSRNIVSQNNIDMTGTEYRSHLIKCLCLNKWEPECAVQVASTFREVALSNEELQWLIEKLLKVLQEVEMQEIPTLVYQLLLLSSKGFRKQLLEKILFYFKNQADILKKQKLNRDRNKENESMHSNDTIKHIEGTVILHITFAAKQDQEIGKEFVKLLKNSQHQPEHLLSSFCIALALSIAKMQRFEEQIIDVLKHIIIYYFQENEKKTHSYWMREMLSANYNLSALILETIKTSKFGWDYVTQSLVKLGFTLMDSFGPKGTFGKIPDIGVFHTAYTPNENACSLGAEILQETFKIHETVREEILQQILNRVITKTSRPVFHYIDVIAKTIKAAPQQLLDILRKFREILDYVPFLPYPSAITFLRALTPLLKISSPLKDALMVVLRKALFHREIDARKVAISGFLIVLRNFKLLEGSGIQNSYSQSSISLSQAVLTMERDR